MKKVRAYQGRLLIKSEMHTEGETILRILDDDEVAIKREDLKILFLTKHDATIQQISTAMKNVRHILKEEGE